MPKKFEGLGVEFLYPDSWKPDEVTNAESEASSTLESPEGAFMTISRLDANIDPQNALDSVRQAMSVEYDQVEEDELNKQVAGFSLEGITQRFVYLDLIITSQLILIKAGDVNYVVQFQAEDRDFDKLAMVFDAILVSMLQSIFPDQSTT